jgi:hypothetical protein
MNKFMSAVLASFLMPGIGWSVPAPSTPPSAGPSPECQKLIDARRQGIQEFRGTNPDGMNAELRAEFERRLQPHLEALAAALAHGDPHVYSAAVHDLINGEYRFFPKVQIYAMLLPRIKAPETNDVRIDAQQWVLVYLSGADRGQAKEALPDMLKIILNDKAKPLLRAKAIEAAARIAPGDPAVINAFVTALKNPNPESTSGVHDTIAQELGTMGKSAAPAKKALIELFKRGEFYQDPAYIALGKIERDEKPRALAEYLDRLGKIDAIPVEQAAAAFLHVVDYGCDVRKIIAERIVSQDVARAARPVLLKIVAERPNDVHSRAALRALFDLGAGSNPHTAKILAKSLVKYHDELEAARKEFAALPPAIKRNAKNEAFFRIYSYNRDALLLQALARLEPTEKDAAIPIAEAFATFAPQRDEWPVAQSLAKNLARFGKGARPAVPTVIKALRSLPLVPERNVFHELFIDYLAVLSAAGGDVPEVRRTVVELLDPGGAVLTRTGAVAEELQLHLLLTLARIGLPTDKSDRATALNRVREGLASDRAEIFSASAVVVSASALTTDEAKPIVKALARVLDERFMFRVMTEQSVRHLRSAFSHEQQVLIGPGLAVQALGSQGHLARDALPQVKSLASQQLTMNDKHFRVSEPPINFLIREARKAQKQIEGTK